MNHARQGSGGGGGGVCLHRRGLVGDRRRYWCLLACGVLACTAAACRGGGERASGPPVPAAGKAGARPQGAAVPAPAAKAPAPGSTEALAARLIQERYRVPEAAVSQARRDGASFEEILVAANLSARAGRPFQEALQARKKGEEWAAIGRRYGLGTEELSRPAAPPLGPDDEGRFREVLGRQFGVPELAVAQLRRDGFSPVEILAAAALTGGGEADVSQLLYGTRQGRGWQAAAARAGGRRPDAPGVAGSAGAGAQTGAPRPGADQAAPYYRALLTTYYGLRPEEVAAAAQRGVPWGDLLVSANAAASSGRPFAQVVSLRAEGLDWPAVERRLGLAAGGALRLPQPKKR